MDIFYALAEPTRRGIFELLAHQGCLSARDIFDNFKISFPAISQHLKVLKQADLVTMEKHAQQHIYQINPASMLKLEQWAKEMNLLWDARFEKLDELLYTEKNKLNKHV